jgi:hypothetical protein
LVAGAVVGTAAEIVLRAVPITASWRSVFVAGATLIAVTGFEHLFAERNDK